MCGALDGLGLNRRQMILMLPQIVARLDNDRSHNITGQIGFFDEGSQFAALDEPEVPQADDFPYERKLADEKAITGLYLSGHPMQKYKDLAAAIAADRIVDLLQSEDAVGTKYRDNDRVRLLGVITSVEKKTTKNNTTMCFFQLEDMTGSVECLVFSKLFAEKQLLLQTGTLVLAEGRISRKEEQAPSVLCDRLEANPEHITSKPADGKKQRQGIFLRIPSGSDPRMTKLKTLCGIFDGTFPVYTFFADEKKYAFYAAVANNPPLIREMEEIFGADNVAVRGG